MDEVLEYGSAVGKAPGRRWRWIVMIQLLQALLLTTVMMAMGRSFPAMLVGLGESVVVGLLQWGMLAPIVEPRVDREYRRKWTYWLSASVVGLFAGVLMCMVVGMAGDVLWFGNFLPSTTSGKAMSEPAAWGVALAGMAVFLISWGVMTPLLVVFMRGRRPEKALAQVAGSLFLGTIVEALSAVGIMVMINKRSDCACATFSGLALVLSFAVGFVVFGPAVLLLVLWRRSRFRPMGLCGACGADLSGLGYPVQCPACGAGWKVVGA